MVRDLQGQLREMFEPVVRMLGYELVGIEYLQGAGGLLRVYIDTPAGITIEDCERVSRQVSSVLDVEDPIRGRYRLEVSSPGLDRPLFTTEHFRRFAGNLVKVRLSFPMQGRRNFTGLLQGLKDGQVLLEVEGQEVTVPFDRIEKARVIPVV